MLRFWISSFVLLFFGDLSLNADKVPVYNPVRKHLPYVDEIPEDLFRGGSIRIRGHVSSDVINSVQVNLSPGRKPHPEGAVHFHIGIRYDKKEIVRNTLKHRLWGNDWGKEENYGGFPVAPNEHLEISILAKEHNYEVAINGRHFCEYIHRRPLDAVKYLHIQGDWTVESITTDYNKLGAVMPTSLLHISC